MPVPTTITDLSDVALSNFPQDSDSTGATVASLPRAIQAILKKQFIRGSDITVTGSGSITMPVEGSYFVVNGSGYAISGLTANYNGRIVTVEFTGALTLTNSASFILVSGVNITTAAGDVAIFVNETGSTWRCISYNSVVSPYAKLVSPAFTGTPTVPTVGGISQDTTIASTGFVEMLTGSAAVSVAGGVDVTLTDNQSARQFIRFTGAITANINVIFNSLNRKLWVIKDNTTGAFTITCKYSSGVGVTLPTSKTTALIVGDGSNIRDGVTLLNSPAMQGTPTAPTAPTGTNTTQIATTAFVNAESVGIAGTDTITGVKTFQAGSEPVALNICKAWCNFDGTLTGTNAPRKGFNIANITRTSAGTYTVTFTNAMPDKNYALLVSTSSDSSAATMVYEDGTYTTARGTTSFNIQCAPSGASAVDRTSVSVMVLG